MIKFNRVNYFKFVLSLFFIVFFIFVIANANLFDKGQEQLTINSSFIDGDDGLSYAINLDNINMDIDTNNNGVIQYTVQEWDTLPKIAGVFWTTVSSIKKENNLKKDALDVGQVLKISEDVDGIIYTIKEKTNVLVFSNTYTLNLQDIMTLNYIQDETELFTPWQDVFLNITKEKAYDLWLLERPKPVIIPKKTVVHRPVINQSGKPTTQNTTVRVTSTPALTADAEAESMNTKKWTIISQWRYTKPIKNKFYAWYCTWYAAIISPEIFPYIDETTQDRPFGGDAKERCANAKAAGFRVGNTPAVGALIVYTRLRSSAGHVGKVINYYPNDGKMIIRDMNYIAKFVVTERWEEVNNKSISCYIYWK